MNFNNYLLISLLAITIFSSTTIFNNNFSVRHDINKENNNTSPNFLQNLYAIEEDDDDEDNDKGEDEKKNFNHKKDKSVVNFVAVGDWDCTGETEDTVDNIIEQDPELVFSSW